MRLLAQTVFTVSISDKERLGANQSTEIRIEAQHCVPLRMNPNFSDAAFHIRSISDVLSISAADVNSFSSPEPLDSQGELIVYPSSRRPSASVGPSVHHFQRSSPLKQLGQSKPNFMWSLLKKGERKFI